MIMFTKKWEKGRKGLKESDLEKLIPHCFKNGIPIIKITDDDGTVWSENKINEFVSGH